MIDTVLIDFDGTIVDSREIQHMAIQSVVKKLGLPPVSRDKVGSLMGVSFKSAYARVYPKFMGKYKQSIDEYERIIIADLTKSRRFFPSAVETLRELRRRKLKVGIVTSGSRHIVKAVLDHYEVCYDALVTADDTKETRPDPKPIKLALKLLGSKARNAIYVGNEPLDSLQGRNAKVKTCIVLTTHKKWEFETTPDYFLRNIDDLLTLVESI
jgi:pyrophosphatase PpaX